MYKTRQLRTTFLSSDASADLKLISVSLEEAYRTVSTTDTCSLESLFDQLVKCCLCCTESIRFATALAQEIHSFHINKRFLKKLPRREADLQVGFPDYLTKLAQLHHSHINGVFLVQHSGKPLKKCMSLLLYKL